MTPTMQAKRNTAMDYLGKYHVLAKDSQFRGEQQSYLTKWLLGRGEEALKRAGVLK